MYHHRQIGVTTLSVSLAAGAMTLALAAGSYHSALISGRVLLLLFCLLFSSLTIEVDATELRHYFGRRFWLKRIPLASIGDVVEERSLWYEGFGIRTTPDGMLYNVSGFRVVAIHLHSGVRSRLGTDDSSALAEAIRTGIPAPPA